MKTDDSVIANSDEEITRMALGVIYLMLIIDIDMGKMWKNYVEEIKTRSRFFPKSQLLEEIEKMTTYATSIVNTGTLLYRARSYNTKLGYAENELPYILQELRNGFPDLNLEIEDVKNTMLISLLDIMNGTSDVRNKTINQRITELKGSKGTFYGFDENGSDAPAPEKVGNGRANAKYISFLYSAFDVETAIMEIVPKIDQPISVAEIELIRDIKIFDFSSYHKGEEGIGKKLDSLSRLFSSPNYHDESEYLPTQYLCEYIRELGFEGVCFNSSVNSGHKNLVIFDCNNATKPYKINGSKVYNVCEQKIKYEQILPQY